MFYLFSALKSFWKAVPKKKKKKKKKKYIYIYIYIFVYHKRK